MRSLNFDKTVYPVPLKGEITMPPSKSMAHRVVLAAALAKGKSIIHNIAISEDVSATITAVRQMGAQIEEQADCIVIEGIRNAKKDMQIDCGESGTTLRLLIPVLAAMQGGTLDGRGRLPQRPVDEYLKIFTSQGLLYKRDAAGLPMTVEGGLKSGIFRLSGQISSQYISGLMFALPLLEKDSEIVISDTLESSGYVDMTLQALHMSGIAIEETIMHKQYCIKGNQQYKPFAYTVEGDWSQAAFFLLAGIMGTNVVLKGLAQNTNQKDREFLSLLKRMGADIEVDDDIITARKSPLHAVTADVSQIPDSAPALAAAMCIAKGRSLITGGKRLRIKESDRITATVEAFKAIGADIEETQDGMAIEGKPKLRGGVSSSHHDHRIAMALAVVAAACEGSITIKDAQAVNKSYPSFFEDYMKLGGTVE